MTRSTALFIVDGGLYNVLKLGYLLSSEYNMCMPVSKMMFLSLILTKTHDLPTYLPAPKHSIFIDEFGTEFDEFDCIIFF